MLGTPDMMIHRGHAALNVATDPSGSVTAILSKKAQVTSTNIGTAVVAGNGGDQDIYYISIWLHLYGMMRIGEILLPGVKQQRLHMSEAEVKRGQMPTSTSTDTASDSAAASILWHPRGRRLVAIVNHQAFIITLNWQDAHTLKPTTLACAFGMSAVDSDSLPECPVKVILACPCVLPTQLYITSVCLIKGFHYFIITLQDGRVGKVSWRGVVQGLTPLSSSSSSLSAVHQHALSVEYSVDVAGTGAGTEHTDTDEHAVFSSSQMEKLVMVPVPLCSFLDTYEGEDEKENEKEKHVECSDSDSDNDNDNDNDSPSCEKGALLVGYSCQIGCAALLSCNGNLSFIHVDGTNTNDLLSSVQLRLSSYSSTFTREGSKVSASASSSSGSGSGSDSRNTAAVAAASSLLVHTACFLKAENTNEALLLCCAGNSQGDTWLLSLGITLVEVEGVYQDNNNSNDNDNDEGKSADKVKDKFKDASKGHSNQDPPRAINTPNTTKGKEKTPHLHVRVVSTALLQLAPFVLSSDSLNSNHISNNNNISLVPTLHSGRSVCYICMNINKGGNGNSNGYCSNVSSLTCRLGTHLEQELYSAKIDSPSWGSGGYNCGGGKITLALGKLIIWYVSGNGNGNDNGSVNNSSSVSTLLQTPPILIPVLAAGNWTCSTSPCSGSTNNGVEAGAAAAFLLDIMHGKLLWYTPMGTSVGLDVGEEAEDDIDSEECKVGTGVALKDMYSDPVEIAGLWCELALPRAIRSEIARSSAASGAGSSKEGYLLCAQSHKGLVGVTYRPGMYGAGYFALAVTGAGVHDSQVSSSSSSSSSSSTSFAETSTATGAAAIWLYGERTRKWRSSCYIVDDDSNAMCVHYSTLLLNSHSHSRSTSTATATATVSTEENKAINLTMANLSVHGPLRRVFALRWVGDHTLIILSERYVNSNSNSNRKTAEEKGKGLGLGGVYVRCLEVASRAVTLASLRRGSPQPETHIIIMLPTDDNTNATASTSASASASQAVYQYPYCLLDSLSLPIVTQTGGPFVQNTCILVASGASTSTGASSQGGQCSLLAIDLHITQNFTTTSTSAAASTAVFTTATSSTSTSYLDQPPQYSVSSHWHIPYLGVGGRDRAIRKAALLLQPTAASSSLIAETAAVAAIGVVILENSGTVHVCHTGISSSGGVEWKSFPGKFIDVIAVEGNQIRKLGTSSSDSSGSSDGYTVALPAPALLTGSQSSSCLVFLPVCLSTFTSISNNSGSTGNSTPFLWIPCDDSTIQLLPSLTSIHKGLWLSLSVGGDAPVTSSAEAETGVGSGVMGRYSMLTLGALCVSQGCLYSFKSRGSVHPLLQRSSNNNISSNRDSYARGVLAGLPAGTLSIHIHPCASSILLHLASCKSNHAVQYGKMVLESLYSQTTALFPCLDILEEVLRDLLMCKFQNNNSNSSSRRSLKVGGKGNSSSNNSNGNSNGHVFIDSESSTLRVVNAIASIPEMLGIIAPSPTKDLSNSSTSTSSSSSSVVLTYGILLQFLFASDPLLFFELTSNLGRKIEPEMAKTLIPYALQSPYGPTFTILRSPLSLYEECLSQDLLLYASRYLTLACEYIGGTTSFHSSLECISLTLELINALMIKMRLSMTVECVEFCVRLETIVECMVDVEIMRRLQRKTTIGSGASTATASGGNGTTAVAPLRERIYKHWLRVSPALTHYLSGKALWTALSDLDEQLHSEQARGQIRGTGASTTSRASASAMGSTSSTTGNVSSSSVSTKAEAAAVKYVVFMEVKQHIGNNRFDEILGVGVRHAPLSSSSSSLSSSSLQAQYRISAHNGVSFSSALLSLTCEKHLTRHRPYACSLLVLGLLSSESVKMLLRGHLSSYLAATASVNKKDHIQSQSQSEHEEDRWSFEIELLRSFGFLSSAVTQPVTIRNRLNTSIGFVFLKQRCSEEICGRQQQAVQITMQQLQQRSNSNSNNQLNSRGKRKGQPLHDLEIPSACFPPTKQNIKLNRGEREGKEEEEEEEEDEEEEEEEETGEIRYAQLMRCIILACILSDRMQSACVLAATMGLPHTASCIAIALLRTNMTAETIDADADADMITSRQDLLASICSVLIDAPCHITRRALCTIDSTLLLKAKRQIEAETAIFTGKGIGTVTGTKEINIGTYAVQVYLHGCGLRDCLKSVTETADGAVELVGRYLREHCREK